MNKVAIIMSVYKNDRLDYFQAAIESLRNQTFKDIKVFLCIDGPLSGNVVSYIESIAVSMNIQLIKNELNIGLAKSLNLLIDCIVSEGGYRYIARMDADDICTLDRIEKQVEFMEKHPLTDVSGGFCREFGSKYALECKRMPLGMDEIWNVSISRSPFVHPTVIFRASIFDDNSIRYPVETYLTEDLAFWYNLLNSGFIFSNIPEIILLYRLSDETFSRRLGFNKAYSEAKLRFGFMIKSKKISVKNLCLVISRVGFQMLPVPIVRLLYKYVR